MTGVEPENDGIASFHATFSVCDHFTGRLVSSLTPLRDGPRQFGQSASAAAVAAARGFGGTSSGIAKQNVNAVTSTRKIIRTSTTPAAARGARRAWR
jgi:hypothetical protein